MYQAMILADRLACKVVIEIFADYLASNLEGNTRTNKGMVLLMTSH